MENVHGTVVLRVHGSYAIPRGHRVEVRVFYSIQGGGLFASGTPQPDHEHPLVTDLETGVRYGTLDHFHPPVTGYSGHQIFAASPEPLPTLREHSRWVGRVLVCNVIHKSGWEPLPQTTFVLEPMQAPQAGYR